MSLLNREKLPYLLTILIGLFTYQVNNIIALQNDAALLSYYFEEISRVEQGEIVTRELECHLVNYSRKKSIRDINLELIFKSDLPEPKKVSNPRIIAVAPASLTIDSMSNEYELMNYYYLPVIHPSSEYVLQLTTTTNETIHEYPKLYFSAQGDVRLVAYNIEAFIASNQVCLQIIALLVTFALLLIYTLKVNKNA